jgi:metallo beta-lactamase superfamily hydrolase
LFVQNEQVALVDCGTRSTGENVVKYLNELGINKIDYLFGTHPHDDHMGGMYDVITNFEIGKIIIPEVEPGKVTSNWYAKLMKEIKDKNYNVEYPVVGTTYNLGKSTMKVIASMKDPGNNLNNYSTVLKVSFGDMDIIMTGDAETEVEKEILQSGENIEAEILKIGHHGSNTSTSDEFLEAVNPDYALISAKVGNKYEHPVKSTMEKLKNNSIIVYRTDESGTVEITITTDDVSFSCEPGDYLCGVELEEKNTK